MVQKKENKEPVEQQIPEMQLNNYSLKEQIIEQDSAKKIVEKTKKEISKLKGFLVRKYPFIEAIGILPSQSVDLFIEEEIQEDLNEKELEDLRKKIHLFIIIPEDKFKEIPKIKKEIILELQKSKQDIWIHIKTPVDVWEFCLDSKFDLVNSIGMSFPVYDKGILGAMRVAQIHKSLVVQKFEKYVVSYVLGGSLVRGEATDSSDIDVFVIINDTDVKRMPRLELKERLRGIIYQYVGEALALAGTKNKLEPQIYLLTDFWESVKDAHPVMFTFIRDGVPIYDRGTFMPWKSLLRMGKLKPSPEAIDMFMSMGDNVISRSKRIFLSEIFTNIFWGVTHPAQALLMLAGRPPPNAKKELVREFKKEFVNTRMIQTKYLTFLEKVIEIWRDYEHEKIKEIKGAELDKLMNETEDYLSRLKDLRKQIEKKSNEKTILQINQDILNLLKGILKYKNQSEIIFKFEKLVKEGKFTQNHLKSLKDVIKAKKEIKKSNMNLQKIDNIRKNANILINDLIEYSQRCELMFLEKTRMKIKYKKGGKEKLAEILHCEGASFLFTEKIVKKITNKIEKSSKEEFSNYFEKNKPKKELKVNRNIFDLLQKELGDFEIIL